MFRFLKIQRTDFPLMEPYWVLHISTLSECVEFLKVRELVFANSFMDVKHNASPTAEDCSKRQDGGHFDSLGALIVRMLRDNPTRPNNFVDELQYLNDKLMVPIIRVFSQFGEIFVNERFGFCIPQGMTYNVLEACESEAIPTTEPSTYNHPTMIFPHRMKDYGAPKIKYIQWPDGTHWYVKIGNDDVVWEGEQKWDTREEAERIANLYIQKHQIKISS